MAKFPIKIKYNDLKPITYKNTANKINENKQY